MAMDELYIELSIEGVIQGKLLMHAASVAKAIVLTPT